MDEGGDSSSGINTQNFFKIFEGQINYIFSFGNARITSYTCTSHRSNLAHEQYK